MPRARSGFSIRAGVPFTIAKPQACVRSPYGDDVCFRTACGLPQVRICSIELAQQWQDVSWKPARRECKLKLLQPVFETSRLEHLRTHSPFLLLELQVDRARAQKRKDEKGVKAKDKDGLTAQQRKERDAKALQEKQSKKAASEAGK